MMVFTVFPLFQFEIPFVFSSCLYLQASCIAVDYKLTLGGLAADSPDSDYEKMKSQVRRDLLY